MTLKGFNLALLRVVVGVPLLVLIYSAVMFNMDYLSRGAISFPRFTGWNLGLFAVLSVGVLAYGVRAVGRSDPLKISVLLIVWAALNLTSPIVQLAGGFQIRELWFGEAAVNAAVSAWYGQTWRADFIAAIYTAIGFMTVLAIAPIYLVMALIVKMREWMTPDERVKKVDRTKEARWASSSEIEEAMGTEGLVIGEAHDPRANRKRFDPANPKSWGKQGKRPLIHFDPRRGNGHILAFSSSGTFKTSGLVIPNALTWTDPIIVIDPKGEIYEETAAVRRSMGRRPIRVTAENGLDPFALLSDLTKQDPSLYTQLASFMFSPKGQQRSVDEFFEAHSNKLATALIAWFQHKGTADIPGAIYDLISWSGEQFTKRVSAIAVGAEEAKQRHILFPMRQFMGTGKEHTSNEDTKKTLANAVAFAAFESLTPWLVNGPDAPTAADLLSGEVDLYIQMPTNQIKAHPAIARLILGAIYLLLDHHEGVNRSGRHWVFMLDEANSLGRMPVLEATRDEGRAKGLHLMQIFQSYQQLVEHYGKDGASAWQQGTDLRIWGPVADHDSARALSAMIGQESVKTVSANTRHSSSALSPMPSNYSGGTSENLRDMSLMDEAELGALPPETIVVFRSGLRPFVATKAIWFTRAHWLELVRDAKARFSSAPTPPRPQAPKFPVLPFAPMLPGSGEEPTTPTTEESPASEPTPSPVAHAPVKAPDAGKVKAAVASHIGESQAGITDDEADRPSPAGPQSKAIDAEREARRADALAAIMPVPRNPVDDDSEDADEIDPAASDLMEDQLSLFGIDSLSGPGTEPQEDEAGSALGETATAVDDATGNTASDGPIESTDDLPPATSIEVALPAPPKPAPKRNRRSEAAELARLREELPAEQAVFALFAGAKSPPIQPDQAKPAKAQPDVEKAEPDVAAVLSDDQRERPTPPKSKYTPEQILALRQAVYKRTQHYTMMSSMLHMRSPIPLRSRLSVLAATLPQSENAEVARIEPRKLTPQSQHSERQSIVVLEPDHFVRYVLTADNSAVEHVMDRVEIDDEMRRHYIEPRKMQEITQRIAEVGPLSVPEV